MFRIVKKPELSPLKSILAQVAAIVAALVFAGVIIFLIGYNPFEFFSKLIAGAVGTKYKLTETVKVAVPLVILSLGTLVAFKMKFWNIGAEGQLCMGAFAASFFALTFPDLPAFILLPIMFLAGFVFGGLWAFIPAFLKVRFGTNETLVTLMLNYIALNWISYLQNGPWRADGLTPKIAMFSANGQLPKLFGVHIGWIIALVFVVLIHILISRTKFGYEISVLGESTATARYAGINVKKVTLLAIMLSGALCGVAGMIEASAVQRTLNVEITGGLGFTAVITTYLARLSPPAVIVTSVLYAILLVGGNTLDTMLGIPIYLIYALQALIILFVLGSEFFLNYKIVLRNRKGGAN